MSDVNAELSSAFKTILDVVGRTEPRIAEATRQELSDQRESLNQVPMVASTGSEA